MNIKGQCHSLTLVQISESVFFNFFSSVTTRPIEAKFHVEPPWNGGTKASSNGLGHMTKARWPQCPYMAKTFKSLLLWNLKVGDLETKYAPSNTWVLPCLFKWLTDLFYGKVKFGRLPGVCSFVLEKAKTMDFSETFVVYDIKLGRCSQLKWIHEASWVPKVKVIHWRSKSLRFNIYKLLFLNKHWF